MDFFKHHASFYTVVCSVNIRGLPLSELTVSLHSVCWTLACGKTPTTVIWSELVKIRSHAIITSCGSRPGVWGWVSQIGGRRKGLHLLKYQMLSATIVACHSKVVTFCWPKKWPFLLVELCDFSGITIVYPLRSFFFPASAPTGPFHYVCGAPSRLRLVTALPLTIQNF